MPRGCNRESESGTRVSVCVMREGKVQLRVYNACSGGGEELGGEGYDACAIGGASVVGVTQKGPETNNHKQRGGGGGMGRRHEGIGTDI